MVLSLSRRLNEANDYVRRAAWGREPFGPGRSIARRRLGILGMGRIGQAIAHRGSAFGMQIGYHSRRRADHGLAWFPTAFELATWADVLVAALPGGTATSHLVDGRVLRALGPDGLFVNVGRGSNVDEAALLEALRSESIAGAGLDVFEKHPVDIAQFSGLSNLILTPHIGSATTDTRTAMADSVYNNVHALLSGDRLHDLAI
jgi:lactate dehydrogenase-like 2-hydroxyacid dehydrogenase